MKPKEGQKHGDATYSMARGASLATRFAQSGIVAAGALVFARLGFAKARVEDILEQAGIARRTFYKSFKSKEEVLAAIYDIATSELLKAIREVPAEHDPLAGIRLGLDAYLDYHVDNAALLKVLVEQAILSESPLARARLRFRAELTALLDAAVTAAGGERRDAKVYLALISALEGLSLELLAEGANVRDVELCKRAMHHLLDRVLASK
jgi:AcrR family transcriptional regulator